MAVKDVLEYLAGGMTVAGLLDEFPNLTDDDIRACLAYATETAGNGPSDPSPSNV
jgi:uncharacterized protein (DUF433 family)